MIEIIVKKDTITVLGHANASSYGQDIVCASVSSIIYTTVNGIFNIDKSAIEFIDEKELLKITIMNHSTVVDILIENMIVLLEQLELEYPKSIKIKKEIKKT
ncbi:MAG: ribosomal-processing cysteine protease Prp [Firmicutes bacterium]|nr:ribosomal-processing cysteine protease Prp [Bacillota bacterium]